MKSLFYLVFLSIIFIFVSCQKEEINNPDSEGVAINSVGYLFDNEELIVLDSIEVTADGALNFLSPTAYYRNVRKLLECSDKKLDSWEQSIGFSSMRGEVNKIMDLAYRVSGETSIADLARQYFDLVEIGSKGELKPIVEAVFYRNILNKAGYFYMDGDKYEVTNESVTVTPKNTLTRTASTKYSFSYSGETIYTRASPGTRKLTGLEGCQTGGGKIINGSHEEIIFETKYKVYKNGLLPPAISSYSERFGPTYTFITYYLDYYVQIDFWQWKFDSWHGVWSYYRPTYELVIKNMEAKIKYVTKTVPNIIGNNGDYHVSYTIQMGTIQGESIPYNSFETWKDQPTIPLEYLYYDVANFESGYNNLKLVYIKRD